MARIKIEEIREELKKDNWKIISEEYINLDTEMIFECSEGHRVYASWKKIRQKRECPICKQNIYKNTENKIIPKKKGTMRILALDQATRITGWAIFDGQKLINYGKFESTLNDEIARDNAIRIWLISMINNWQPDYIGIEDIQLQEKSEDRKMGVTVFKTLARLQGVLLETAFANHINYKVCSPSTWREHCGVKGKYRTDKKRSMQLLAKKWYDITLIDDEADAIGIGKYLTDTCGSYNILEDWE